MQDTIRNIFIKQLDSLLVRGTQVETEVLDRVSDVIDTSMFRPEIPHPLEQAEEPADTANDASYQNLHEGADAPPTMPTSQSRTASALLQLQDAIASIQVRRALYP